jgi:crotonobetainyl-CoA:carnitine CoA-transferase CaiB-like acyl-CoA transferase
MILVRALSTRAARAAPPPLMAGMKVIELANVLAGPTVCQFLAELGAEVIKIENTTTQGDVTRTWRLENDPDDSSVTAYFSCCNLGKQSVALDLRDSRGLAAVHAMVQNADVVVASYKPGDAEKLKVDYQTLSRLNPSLVYAQITGYGLDDARAGYDAVIQAESGFQFMNGEAAPAPPTKMPVALMDLLAAHQLKEGILASMWQRERDGSGNFVSVSLMGAGVSALANQATGYLKAEAIPQRIGSDHPSICPYGTVFECGDGGLITLAVGSDKQFANLCDVLGCPDVARDERYQTNPARVQHRENCKMMMREMILKVDRPTLLKELRANSVPAGGVNNMADVFAQKQAEDLVVRDEHGAPLGVRQVAFVNNSSGGSGNSGSGGSSGGSSGESITSVSLLPPPEYAEHTKEVLMQYLDEREVEELIEEGVVEQRR